MIEAMVRYGEYLAEKENLDLELFENLVKDALLNNKADALDKLMNFFKFAVDFHSTLIYVYDGEKQDYKEADVNVRFKIFPLANLSGKVKNAVGANHPILNSKNIEKYDGVIIQESDIKDIQKEILKNEFGNRKLASLTNTEKEKLKKTTAGELQKRLEKNNIFLNPPDVLALIEKFEMNKGVKKVVIVPRNKITEIDARDWVIEKLLFGDKPSLSEETYPCPLCGRHHKWENVKLFFPINIQSEETLNFLPNFSPEGKQKVCVTCAYKLLRLTDSTTQFTIGKKNGYHAKMLAYPYGYTREGIQFAEMVLNETKDKSEGLFALPEAVWNITKRENRDEILGEINSSELWLYLALSEGKAERVIASYHLTDFSKLAQFGKYHVHIDQFRNTIAEYMKISKKKKQHKIVLADMLASMYANFDVKSLNVSFIKSMAKTIIQKARNPKLYGKYFISSYLYVCGGDSLGKKTVDVYRRIYDFGVTLGELWRKLAESDKNRFNSYKAKIMKLDSPNVNVLSDTVRYMIQRIAENEQLYKDEEIGSLFSEYKDFPKIVTDVRARELFVTGAYFGFFSPLKNRNGGGKP
ncbi:MAG: hypothetical protein PWQ27_1804 [Kosmotoga sp.]|nr:hypothetical protein [Kosmotoga sp.]